MKRVALTLNKAGVRDAALTSPGVRSAVAAVAEGIAARARAKTDNEIITVHAGKSRARSYVRMLGDTAAADEARDRILGGSVQ